MSKKVVKVSPYCFPGIKLSQKEKEEFRNSQRSLRYRMSKDEILQIIADECTVSVSDIIDKTRKKEVVNGRFIFCGIMKDYYVIFTVVFECKIAIPFNNQELTNQELINQELTNNSNGLTNNMKSELNDFFNKLKL